jgi:hypothetical protein
MKRPLKGTLREALLAVKIARQRLENGILFEAAGSFTLRAKEVEKLLDSWSQYQVDRRLVEVVEGIYQLQQIKGLPDLIRTIPNKDMDPSSRTSLLNIISKVSRYWEAARFLYRLAKKSPLARAMTTVPVRLPKEAFSIPTISGYAPDLRSKITEATPRGSQQKLLKEICAILNISQQDAVKKYSCQVKRTLSTAKIHAEIQLIAHCELENPGISPRVLEQGCLLSLQLVSPVISENLHTKIARTTIPRLEAAFLAATCRARAKILPSFRTSFHGNLCRASVNSPESHLPRSERKQFVYTSIIRDNDKGFNII